MKNTLSIVAIVISIGALIHSFFSHQEQESKTVYIDVQTVFSGFDGASSYKIKLENLIAKQKVFLDSLRLNVLALESQHEAGGEIVNRQKEYYNHVYDESMKVRHEETQKYDQKIWVQINQFLEEYGKEKKFDFVLGAKADGSIMYSKPELDMTQDAIIYINQKYKGE